MKKQIFILTLISIFFAFSCKKKIDAAFPEHTKNKKEKVLPETPEELKIVEEIKSFSPTLQKLCKIPAVNREIAALVLSNYYYDERVKIKDLLDPGNSPIYKKATMDKIKFKPGSFKEAYLKLTSSGTPLRVDRLYESELSIYYPYSEVTNAKIADGEPITYVSAEYTADEGPGYVLDNTANEEVIVNDDYAYNQPVFILTMDADPVPNDPCATNPTWCNPSLPTGLGLRRVEMGWVRSKDNWDALIGFNSLNCGGNEVVFARSSGYLHFDSDGQITEFTNISVMSFTRMDGRNKTWTPQYITWDPDWTTNNLEQVMVVWEKDSKNTQEVTGSLTTTLKHKINETTTIEVVGSVGYKNTIVSQEPISFQHKFSWNAYVGTARNPINPNNQLSPIVNNSYLNLVGGFLTLTADFSTGVAYDQRYLVNGEKWPIINFGMLTDATWPYQIVQ